MEDFPEVSCQRCSQLNGPLYTVPLRLIPASEQAWQSLCGDCFRAVLNVEPWDDLTMKPVRHGRRARHHYRLQAGRLFVDRSPSSRQSRPAYGPCSAILTRVSLSRTRQWGKGGVDVGEFTSPTSIAALSEPLGQPMRSPTTPPSPHPDEAAWPE